MEIYSHPYRRTTGRLSVTLNREGDHYALTVDTLKDAPGTLYRLCAVLFRHDWDVQNAEICTMENLQVVDRFLISPASREEVDEIKFEEMMKDFEHLLFENLDVSAYVTAGRQGEIRAAPEAGEATGAADVRYTKENRRGHLVLTGQDRPGLLLDIAGVFAQREIDILEARIETTAAGQARNDFLINPTDTRFEDAEFCAQLERELRPLL